MFPSSIDRLLFSGFAALVTFGVVPFVYAFLAMLALVAAVLSRRALVLARVQKWQDTLLSKLRSMRSSRRPSPAVTAMLDKSETIYVYGLGLFAIGLLLLLLTVLSSRTGKEQAERDAEKFSKGEGNYVQLLTDMSPSSIKARQIICGATHCAFWVGNETLIFRHEQVRQFAAHSDNVKMHSIKQSVKPP